MLGYDFCAVGHSIRVSRCTWDVAFIIFPCILEFTLCTSKPVMRVSREVSGVLSTKLLKKASADDIVPLDDLFVEPWLSWSD